MGRRYKFGFPSRIVSRRRFQFLAFFRCHELPRIFLERICQPSKIWNDEGEIVECSETIIGLDSDLENIFQEAKDNGIIRGFETLLSQIYVVDESWKQWLSFNTDDKARRNIQFNILELVFKAFPIPYTEISWMSEGFMVLSLWKSFLCRMEALAEGLVNSIFRKTAGQLEMSTTAQKFLIGLSNIPNYYINSELSMVVAFADSLLGQGKHDDALSLFQAILKKGRPGREDITMSVALRISKITRRLNTKSSINDAQNLEHSDAWRVLRDVSEVYPRVSSILKYAYVEEVICHLSHLEDRDTRQRFVASEIIKLLNRESLPYKGSENSRISFFENLQTINQCAEQLKFLMADGAPEFLASKMAQRFPNASVDLIKKISRANWQRFNRIQEMRVMPDIDDLSDAKESLDYRDSGLGSSMKTTSNIPESSNNSVVSYRSFMNNDAKSTTLPQMPETVKSEGQFLCSMCEKTIKGITGEAQYRRHIWADLRPYVCPVKGCDVDSNQLLSRTDFGAHLKEHHATNSLGNKSTERISTLRCPFCDELPAELALIGHICHHLEVESCSIFSHATEEELKQNGLDMTLSDHGTVQEPVQLDPDQKSSQPHEIRRSDEDIREALSTLFKNAWIDTQPITQYTPLNDNNDKLTLKSSTEITDSLVDSFASRDMKGDEALYASNQPASAGSGLSDQDQTHQHHSQLTTITEMSPRTFPSKCPHPKCVFVDNRVYEEHSAWQAHYYRIHEKRFACATCDAKFGTGGEVRRHNRAIHDTKLMEYTCLMPNCQARSIEFNRKHRLKEHKERWHGPYYCSSINCPRGPGHGFKDQTLLNDHLIKAHGHGNYR
ncbi:hypothetical protein BPAE_0179g00110 [Botrytis paeoniae]|uniref:C2H2-type domain-containing protein n=1 Tax=Botrytis paeoniae TaxID=278948 RepID=A0A4Z1FH66_9HELO|nr:hypothetical protein BPAE_0179g00110 [Botrytis paeoniae]